MDATARNFPLDELTTLLAADQDVELAMLFGSSAVGELRPGSDVDVAVLTRSGLTPKRRREIVRAIAEIVGRPVDLVDLRTAGVHVTSQVLRHGVRLVHRRPGVFADLLSRNLTDAADFLPYRERILRERRQAWIG
jgi:predicted nucleotidyltransferase